MAYLFANSSQHVHTYNDGCMCVNDMSEVKLFGRIILFMGNSKVKISNACCKLLHNVLHLLAK